LGNLGNFTYFGNFGKARRGVGWGEGEWVGRGEARRDGWGRGREGRVEWGGREGGAVGRG
jgi:hypothetical protein